MSGRIKKTSLWWNRGEGGYFMPKVIRCRDAGVDCDFVVRGETEEELFRNALEHGRAFHGMKEIPNDLQEKMRTLIREEKAA
jgi:predicted small metal-binding protein